MIPSDFSYFELGLVNHSISIALCGYMPSALATADATCLILTPEGLC